MNNQSVTFTVQLLLHVHKSQKKFRVGGEKVMVTMTKLKLIGCVQNGLNLYRSEGEKDCQLNDEPLLFDHKACYLTVTMFVRLLALQEGNKVARI